MREDYLDIRMSEGMPNLSDSTIALEFLNTIKTGIRNNAMALTVATTLELRNFIKKELENSLSLHDEIYKLMMKKGWFYPYDIDKQLELDVIAARTAVEIAKLDVYPDDTSRRGMFATLDK